MKNWIATIFILFTAFAGTAPATTQWLTLEPRLTYKDLHKACATILGAVFEIRVDYDGNAVTYALVRRQDEKAKQMAFSADELAGIKFNGEIQALRLTERSLRWFFENSAEAGGECKPTYPVQAFGPTKSDFNFVNGRTERIRYYGQLKGEEPFVAFLQLEVPRR